MADYLVETHKGHYIDYDEVMLSDAIATCTGAILGTSTVTTFLESAAGVGEGGRTGLTAMLPRYHPQFA